MRLRLKLLPMVIAALVVLPGTAKASVPDWFRNDANCVHNHEEHWSWRWSPNYHPHYSYFNGYYTGMQFALSTWRRANRLLGSHVSAYTDNKRIVIRHAWVIVRQDNGSWREWRGTADRYCGLPVY